MQEFVAWIDLIVSLRYLTLSLGLTCEQIIYYLRHGSINEAFELVSDLDPATPQEYIIKGVVHATLGQSTNNREHLKMAQQCFQLVGTSAHECDTIPGRQCMASCYFLMKQFEDVNIYLNSVKAYMYNDDDFNYNHGIALAATRNYKSAEEALLLIHNEAYKAEYVYISWLARCYVMNGNPRSAWELYLKMTSSSESFHLLQLIANDSYRVSDVFLCAAASCCVEIRSPPLLCSPQSDINPLSIFSLCRWAIFCSRPRPSTCWSGWTPTPSTGRASAAPAWASSSLSSPARATATTCRTCSP